MTAVNPSGWRPSTPSASEGGAPTVTGNRALMLEEPLLFEIGKRDQTGVDFERVAGGAVVVGVAEAPERLGQVRIGGRDDAFRRRGER